MSHTPSIIAVIDPRVEHQRALLQASTVAKGLKAQLHLFLCDYVPALLDSPLPGSVSLDDKRRAHGAQQLEWLETLAQPIRDQRVDVHCDVVWGKHLHAEIIRKVLRTKADMVFKSAEHHSQIRRTFFSNTDWQLIRECPAPLYLCKLERFDAKPVLLAAVDPMYTHEKPILLDDRILEWGQRLANGLSGVLHAVHWFQLYKLSTVSSPTVEDQKMQHEVRVMDLVGDYAVEKSNVHMLIGKSDTDLPVLLADLDCQLLIMGALTRNFIDRFIIGSTAERLLDKVNCDVLIVKPDDFVSPVTL